MYQQQQPQGPVNVRKLTDEVARRLEDLKDEGLALPTNYSAQNALKAAYLRLQGVKDRQGRPALTVCSQSSIANALLDMAIQGLSPAKNQCYFIVYGNELQMQRSYFGTIAALKRLDSVEDIDAQVVHRGDKFEIGADEFCRTIVTKFEPSFTNLDKELIGAFAFIKLANGRVDFTVMTKAQIDTSWAQSRNRQNKVQDKFSDEMAKRTVLNRAAKMFINTSDDSDLLTGSINAATEAEYEEPKDVTQTAAEEQGSTAKLLADFQEAQQAEEKVKPKSAPVQAPEQPVADEKSKTKEDPKAPVKTSESESEAKPASETDERQMSIDDFLKEGQNA
ncbi:recombinase RecT [Limosilactobacillus fermentum]|uniref:recombinase RecT n=1 Tax=Limosilactobacillus fermentum TaxID=1613 RepID=UPI0018827B53|nr:recombinase RecT [Limosilactobacillus fermentum]MBE8118764.1 recombinase RecT [Limosilactobacillus fermentum]